MLFHVFLFSLVIAFFVAKLEIEIEGKFGWGENLPTWRLNNSITKFFLGKQPLTGYHLWLVAVVLGSLHIGFVMGVPWSLSLELQLVGLFWVAVLVEDFLWFVMNPAFGIKKFNKVDAHWHSGWVGFIPSYYLRLLFLTFLLFIISFFV